MEDNERMALFARQAGFELARFGELTSTNDEAADPRYGAGAVVMAERQSRGRGQRGNRWSSAGGLNLTFSVVLCPDFLRAEQQFYISKAVALAVADTVEAAGLPVRIKWPNDIYIGDGKVAGILIENDLMGGRMSRSIAGVGLNVNQTDFDPSLPNPVSLASATGSALDRARVFERFYRSLSDRYGALAEGDFAATDADYLARLYRFGEEHPFADGRTGERFRGTICGVRPTGELQVRHLSGRTEEYLFKEIEYVL